MHHIIFSLHAEPPQIIIAPNTITEAYDETTVVNVRVSFGRDEVPSIIWKFGDTILTKSTPDVSIYEEQVTVNDLVYIESILTLCNVGFDDAGNYSCTTNNSIGSSESSFTLHVKPNRKSDDLRVTIFSAQ